MSSFIRRLTNGSMVPIMASFFAVHATAATTGQFLYVNNQVAGRGGIFAIDANGLNLYGIVPGSGTGFSTTSPPFANPDIEEISQARANGRIAFGSVRASNDCSTSGCGLERIYVMNGDGFGVQQVTFHNPSVPGESHYDPRISADGSKIAYVNAETLPPPGTISGNGEDCSSTENHSLWVVNSDGSNPHVIRSPNYALVSYCNTGSVVDSSWSPDGTKLVVKDTMGNYNAQCSNEIVVINSDGSGALAINCNNNWGIPTQGLDWSPDGSKVVALAACGGSGGGPTCTQWVIYDTSTWIAIRAIPTPSGNDNFTIRFSPDSTELAYNDPNLPGGPGFVIMDLNGNTLSTVQPAVRPQTTELWWNPSSVNTPTTMTLGVSSVYVNSCPNYMVQLQPSTFDAFGNLITHGYSGVNGNIVSGDGDSWHVDGFGNAYYNQNRDSASGTLQLSNISVSSNTVPLTVDSSCNCQSNVSSGITVTRSGLRYVTSSEQQFVQTLTIKNNTSGPISGPINVVIQSLSANATLTNPGGTTGCTSSGSPYVTVVQSNSALAPGASATYPMTFRDPTLAGFTYSTTVTAGAGAP